MDGRHKQARGKAWFALIAIIAVVYLTALAAAPPAPQTVNIQLVVFMRPNTLVGAVTVYDGGKPVGSSGALGGVVRMVVPMTLGVHQLQAKFVSSVPLYGDSQSQVLDYTVDPANPLVMFGVQ